MDTSSQRPDIIANSLDITPIEEVQKVKSNSVDDDFQYARGNLISIIEKGQEALNGMLEVAQMSQHPRSYEVAATIIKTLSDANKDLMELSKRRKELERDDSGNPSTVNNNLYLGSTSDLLKLLKDKSSE